MPKIFPMNKETALNAIEMITIIVVMNGAQIFPFNKPQETIKLAQPTTLKTPPTSAISQLNNRNSVALDVATLLGPNPDETEFFCSSELSLCCNLVKKREIDTKPIPPNNVMRPSTTRSEANILTPNGQFFFNSFESH